MSLLDSFSANRKKRERKHKRNRILLVAGALIWLVAMLVEINAPGTIKTQLLALPEKISNVFFLAKRGETVPETPELFLAQISATIAPSETSTRQIPGITKTPTPFIVVSETPYPIIQILTGLPEGTVYMRKGPSTAFPVTRILFEGDEMAFLKCVSGWTMVEIDDQIGFVYAKYTNKNCENQE